MSKLFKRMAVIGFISLCSALMLTFLLAIVHLGQQPAQAYPAPATPIPPMAYPPAQPGLWPPSPNNITANNSQSTEGLPYHLFLPIAPFTPKVHFGIAGAETLENAAIITNTAYRVDPWLWGHTPWEENQTQIIRRCHSSQADHWCWIVNETTCAAYTNHCVRSNIADISTPTDFPPSATSGQVTAKKATDGQYDTYWIANASQATITIDLHPVTIDAITITWGITGYARVYDIQIRPNPTAAWETIYEEENGNGLTDTITLDFPILSDDIRLHLQQAKGTSYYLGEFEVYGQVADPFFQRSNPSLSDWIAAHPGTTWLMGNEPDNFDLAAGDGMITQTYANFYATIGTYLRQQDPTAKIVFCQGTKAEWIDSQPSTNNDVYPQFPYGIGPVYCDQVVPLLESLVPTLDPQLTLASIVDAVSTHQYIETRITTDTVESEISQWITNLNDFVAWVDSEPSLAGKPLYLTEYGDYDNRCPYQAWIGTRQCGTEEDGRAFWGANSNAGFFAIQYHTTKYFLSLANTRWIGAWWFYAGSGSDDDEIRASAYRGGVLAARIQGTTVNTNTLQLSWSIWCLGSSLYCQSPP